MSAELLRHLFSLLPACGLPPSWPACVRPCLSYGPGSQAQPAPSVGLRQPLPAPARSWQPRGLRAKHNPPAVDTVVDFQEGREGWERRGEAAKAFNASPANSQLVLAILSPAAWERLGPPTPGLPGPHTTVCQSPARPRRTTPQAAPHSLRAGQHTPRPPVFKGLPLPVSKVMRPPQSLARGRTV